MKNILLLPFYFFQLVLQSMRLAAGQIWANKTRSALTTIGIVIGVASVTAVIAALTGLKAKVLSEFESFGTNKIFILPDWPDSGPLRHASWDVIRLKKEQFRNILDHCPSISQITLLCHYDQTDIRYKDQMVESVEITAIQSSWHEVENRSVLFGRPFSVIDEEQAWQVCLITPHLRDKLKLDQDCVNQRITINNRSFRIVGVVEQQASSGRIGGGRSSTLEAFIPFDTAMKQGENWTWAIATSKKPELSEDAQAELKFFLRRTRHLKPGDPDTFRLEVVEKYLKQFREMSAILTAIAGGIVGISLLVGGIGIMNIMLVSVSERTREIGLRKAVGARPSAILLQFLVEAVTLCLMGGLIGVICGQMLTIGISKIPKPQLDMAHIPFWAIVLSFGFSALVGVFFGMFPAVKAAKLDPIEALRHE